MTTLDHPRTVVPGPARIWSIVKLHVANPVPTLVVPWIITLLIFGLNLAIWLMVVNVAGGLENLEEDAFQYSGGVTWIVIFMMVVAVQAMNLTFPYALGFAVTRRDFYLGSALYFVLLTVLYATGLTLFAAIEKATGGWGIDAAFFAPYGLTDASLAAMWWVYAGLMLLFFFLGAAIATVWVRWRAYGLYAFFIGLAVLLVGAAWAVTAAEAWPEVGAFFADSSPAVVVAWTLPVTLLSAAAGYAFLRRATPRG